MRIGHVELFVADKRRAVEFYRDVLGFQAVAQAPGVAFADSAGGVVLYTDDLDGTRAAPQGRGLVFRGYDGTPDCPTITDPDGNWFQLVDPTADHTA